MVAGLSYSQWISVIGLICDIIGAWLIAYEIFNRYRGEFVKQSQEIRDLDSLKPVLKDDYLNWDSKKHRFLKFGLGFLTLGFLLQIIGIVIQ